jgi:hypothetical protein
LTLDAQLIRYTRYFEGGKLTCYFGDSSARINIHETIYGFFSLGEMNVAKKSGLGMGVFPAIILVFAQFSITSGADNWQLYSTVAPGGGTEYQDTFVTVNQQTGVQTQQGTKGGTPNQWAIDMDPISGFLFGTDVYSKPGVITRIDPLNGQWTEVATIKQGITPINLYALSFSPNGSLYGISEAKTLGVVNLGTSSFSPIAELDIPGQTYGMDFSPQEVLYLVDSYGTGDTFQQWLRTIDALTGQITSTLPTGHYNVGDIDFAPDGYIYHTNFSWWLFKMDPATAEQTDFDSSGGLGPFGCIASDYVPEPATLLLIGLGVPMILRFREK